MINDFVLCSSNLNFAFHILYATNTFSYYSYLSVLEVLDSRHTAHLSKVLVFCKLIMFWFDKCIANGMFWEISIFPAH